MKIKTFIFIVIIIYIAGAILVNALPTDTTADDLLKLRNLQYEQAKRIVRMQELKSEFDKLNSEQQQFSVEINNWIIDQAKKQSKDLTKERFDLDKLNWVEIQKVEKPNE